MAGISWKKGKGSLPVLALSSFETFKNELLTFNDDDSLTEYPFSNSLTGAQRDYVAKFAESEYGFKVECRGGKNKNRHIVVFKTDKSALLKQVSSAQKPKPTKSLHVTLHDSSIEECRKVLDLFPVSHHDRELTSPSYSVFTGTSSWVSRVNQRVIPPLVQEKFAPREKLPAYMKRTEIIKTVKEHQVVLIEGATGSGKTTQVGQFLLENAAENKNSILIICTQPRRLATVTIAERVAFERGESLPGTVGYQIKSENQCNAQTCLTFCTTGVLLKRIALNPQLLNEITHLIVDEAHEREPETDFLLAIVKSKLQNLPNLSLILMSAKMDSNSFSSFFPDCSKIQIEGMCHKVDYIYLDDIVSDVSINGPFAGVGSKSVKLKAYRKNWKNESKIDYELIKRILQAINEKEVPGAVLVFLPGYPEIMSMRDRICKDPNFHVLTLYSDLSMEEQKYVTDDPPDGKRKVVLSTNIAETSITIDDVVYVIDSGKAKVKIFDALTRVTSLATDWIPEASAIQRAGRAGRCQPGVCYRLYSEKELNGFSKFPVPQVKRVPLESLCIRAKLINPDMSIGETLENLPEPPSRQAVAQAIKVLHLLGAIDADENLTNVGHLMVKIPLEPHLVKMVLTAISLGCLNPVVRIVAMMNGLDPFERVRTEEKELFSARKAKLARRSSSDHLVLLRVYYKMQEARGRTKDDPFGLLAAEKYFVSNEKISKIAESATDILDALRSCQFLDDDFAYNLFNKNSDRWTAVKASIISGLYPMIAFVESMGHNIPVASDSVVERDMIEKFESGKIFLAADQLHKYQKYPANLKGVTAASPAMVFLLGAPSDDQLFPRGDCSSVDQSLDPLQGDVVISSKRTSTVACLPELGPRKKMKPASASDSLQLLHALRLKFLAIFLRKMSCPAKAAQVIDGDVQVIESVMRILLKEEELVGLPNIALPLNNNPGGLDLSGISSQPAEIGGIVVNISSTNLFTSSSLAPSAVMGLTTYAGQHSSSATLASGVSNTVQELASGWERFIQRSPVPSDALSLFAAGTNPAPSNQDLFGPSGGRHLIEISSVPAVPSSISANPNRLPDSSTTSTLDIGSPFPVDHRFDCYAPPASQVSNSALDVLGAIAVSPVAAGPAPPSRGIVGNINSTNLFTSSSLAPSAGMGLTTYAGQHSSNATLASGISNTLRGSSSEWDRLMQRSLMEYNASRPFSAPISLNGIPSEPAVPSSISANCLPDSSTTSTLGNGSPFNVARPFGCYNPLASQVSKSSLDVPCAIAASHVADGPAPPNRGLFGPSLLDFSEIRSQPAMPGSNSTNLLSPPASQVSKPLLDGLGRFDQRQGNAPPAFQVSKPLLDARIIYEENGIQVYMMMKMSSDNPDVVVAELIVTPSAHGVSVSNLVFNVAVPTSMKLVMDPPSGSRVASFTPVTQVVRIENPAKAYLETLVIKLSFTKDGLQIKDQIEVKNFSPALWK